VLTFFRISSFDTQRALVCAPVSMRAREPERARHPRLKRPVASKSGMSHRRMERVVQRSCEPIEKGCGHAIIGNENGSIAHPVQNPSMFWSFFERTPSSDINVIKDVIDSSSRTRSSSVPLRAEGTRSLNQIDQRGVLLSENVLSFCCLYDGKNR
jgi:hypothetical protein